MDKTGFKVICGAPTTLAVKGLMMMMTAERTNEAEIGPKEQSEEVESCQENSWNEIQLKGPLETAYKLQ